MNQEQLDQLDPIRCYIMKIPDDAPLYYGRSMLSGEWYIATAEESRDGPARKASGRNTQKAVIRWFVWIG